MRVIFDLGHPAHFHLFKHAITVLRDSGHDVEIIARQKDCLVDLLEEAKRPYHLVARKVNGLAALGWQALRAFRIAVLLAKQKKTDFVVGTSVIAGPVARLTGATSLIFNEDDAKAAPIFAKLAYPAAHYIITPDCLKFENYGKKHITYPGYHELAYLHPGNFIPRKEILKKYNLKEKQYIVVRFSALKAHHDVGAKGISNNLWKKVEKLLNEYEVLKSMENSKAHQIEPWDMHHILAFAKMLICDSQTMTIEGAVLGIPSIRINTFVGKSSIIDELERKYKLAIGILPDKEDDILRTIRSILDNPETDKIWVERRAQLLREKIDFNQWMTDFFENLEEVKNSEN